MANRLTETIVALCQADVQFVVAGGVAAVLHGVERVTLDLDIAVQMTQTNLTVKAVAALTAGGCRSIAAGNSHPTGAESPHRRREDRQDCVAA